MSSCRSSLPLKSQLKMYRVRWSLATPTSYQTINENRDKGAQIINGQDASLVSSHRKTIIVQYPDGKRAFIYPVTHHVEGEGEGDIT